jgi:hypothetical protein
MSDISGNEPAAVNKIYKVLLVDDESFNHEMSKKQ